MDRLLSLSQAARMVGVPRRLLQQHIQEGRINAFEGHIRMSELHKAYPEADSDRSGMLEKVNRIREAALFKSTRDGRPDPEHLATELQRTRVGGRIERPIVAPDFPLPASFKDGRPTVVSAQVLGHALRRVL